MNLDYLKNNIKIDTHTHTIISGHAYNTIKEMRQSAKEKGLELLCITEHGPKLPSAPHEYYFSNLGIMDYDDTLFGIESNIIDLKGNLDYENIYFNNGGLPFVIASFHSTILVPGSKFQNTNAYIKAIEKPFVNVIGHIDDGLIPCDYEEIVLAAKENKVLVEVNNSSLSKMSFRKNSRENILLYLDLCKKYNVPICLSSDAHYEKDIANYSNIYPLLETLDFPIELIVNTSLDKFKDYHK